MNTMKKITENLLVANDMVCQEKVLGKLGTYCKTKHGPLYSYNETNELH